MKNIYYVPMVRSKNACRILTEIMLKRGVEIELAEESLLVNGIEFFVSDEDATFLELSVQLNEYETIGNVLAHEVMIGILESMRGHSYEWK